ncbi:MAG: hypothetical protein WC327_04225, partial [Candidatus Cloacimonadia bacterium]
RLARENSTTLARSLRRITLFYASLKIILILTSYLYFPEKRRVEAAYEYFPYLPVGCSCVKCGMTAK